MSNTLKVGYSRLRDYRDMDGGFFPQVDILKDGSSYTVFGTEANSYNNQLDTDIFQIQDNFTMNYGRHQITVGTQSDYRSFSNRTIRVRGSSRRSMTSSSTCWPRRITWLRTAI